MSSAPPRILLGILVANGDCLLATVLARQIKTDFPGCHLTWAISDICQQVIENNPDVDATWIISLQDKKEGEKHGWTTFALEAEWRKQAGEFDHVFLVQVYPDNVHNYDGTTRGTIYNSYPYPITVDTRPVLRLRKEEVSRVQSFADSNKLDEYKHVIIFECSAFSGQSFVTFDWALKVSRDLVATRDDLIILLSTHLQFESGHSRIIIANEISLRENAELTKYATLLVGCSSGITWMAVTDWAKRLPMLQFLRRGIGFTFASVAYDHQYWGLDNSEIVETTKSDPITAVKLINTALDDGIAECKHRFHEKLRPRFRSLVKYGFMFLRKGQLSKSFKLINNFVRRNYINKK
jgi:hypothetical protein